MSSAMPFDAMPLGSADGTAAASGSVNWLGLTRFIVKVSICATQLPSRSQSVMSNDARSREVRSRHTIRLVTSSGSGAKNRAPS